MVANGSQEAAGGLLRPSVRFDRVRFAGGLRPSVRIGAQATCEPGGRQGRAGSGGGGM